MPLMRPFQVEHAAVLGPLPLRIVRDEDVMLSDARRESTFERTPGPDLPWQEPAQDLQLAIFDLEDEFKPLEDLPPPARTWPAMSERTTPANTPALDEDVSRAVAFFCNALDLPVSDYDPQELDAARALLRLAHAKHKSVQAQKGDSFGTYLEPVYLPTMPNTPEPPELPPVPDSSPPPLNPAGRQFDDH